MNDSTENPSVPTPSPALPSEGVPVAKATWESLGLTEASLELIRKAAYRAPTPVQAEALPIVSEGHDLIASAQTGTGKTAAFVLPMVERFVGREGTYGLILAPTREIAQQIQATIELFGTPRGVRSIVLIGGIAMTIDARALQTYPQIIVATPGRLCDHLDRGNIWLDFIQMVVLDEADRMLDMGFSDQLNRIMEDVPKERQTLLFSATIPPNVENLSRRILKNPKRIAIGQPLSAAKTVEQRLIHVTEADKNRELRKLLRQEPGSIIVFTRSKDKATRVWRSLHSAGVYDATYIHSDRLQSHRESALAEFKEGKYRILVATDVAGRGIHVDGIAHVVNYDLPMEPEDYVHRIGRTGRAEASGKATSFVTPSDRRILADIEKLIGKAIPVGFASDSPRPSPAGHSNGRVVTPRDGAAADESDDLDSQAELQQGEGSSREGGGDGKRRRKRGGRGGGRREEGAPANEPVRADAPPAPRPKPSSNPSPISPVSVVRPVVAAGAAVANGNVPVGEPQGPSSVPDALRILERLAHTPVAGQAAQVLDDSGQDDRGDEPAVTPGAPQGAVGEADAKRRKRRRGGRGRRGGGSGGGDAPSRGPTGGGTSFPV